MSTERPAVTSASPPATGAGRVPLIEMLRGFAALAVLLFHSLAAFDAPGALSPPLDAVRRATEYGHLGVSVFFALSGWCIAQRLHTAFHRRESVPKFLLERALRIFPAYWAALLIALALRLAALPFRESSLAANLPENTLAWVGDFFLLQPYLGTNAYLIVSWSLVYELGFYVVAALALAGRRLGCPTPCLVVGGLLACLTCFLAATPRPLLVLDRWPDFFAGALAWWIARENQSSNHRVGVVAGAAALLLLLALPPAGFGDAQRLTAVGTALVLILASRRAPAPSRLGHAFAWVGALSYSLYLIHVPVISPFVNLSLRFVPSTDALFFAVWLVGLALAIAAGWALHRWIEAPVERWRRTVFTAPLPPP